MMLWVCMSDMCVHGNCVIGLSMTINWEYGNLYPDFK